MIGLVVEEPLFLQERLFHALANYALIAQDNHCHNLRIQNKLSHFPSQTGNGIGWHARAVLSRQDGGYIANLFGRG
jgi:hypothetical protein